MYKALKLDELELSALPVELHLLRTTCLHVIFGWAMQYNEKKISYKRKGMSLLPNGGCGGCVTIPAQLQEIIG